MSFIHDGFFKGSMKKIEVAQAFFSHHLPTELLQQIELSTLQLCDGSYIDEELRASMSDILYSVAIGQEKGYLFLLAEHNYLPLK